MGMEISAGWAGCWIIKVSLYDNNVNFSSLPVQWDLCNADTSGTANGVLMSRVAPVCPSYVYDNLEP